MNTFRAYRRNRLAPQRRASAAHFDRKSKNRRKLTVFFTRFGVSFRSWRGSVPPLPVNYTA
jgi:hypothetical protein